jgi:hypothetical protein
MNTNINVKENYFCEIEINSKIYGSSKKLIVFEPKEIFIDVKAYANHLEYFNEHYKKKYITSNVLVVPFFSGINIYDLNFFLFKEMKSFNHEFNLPIFFKIQPANFNCAGIKRFINYLNYLKNKIPVFKGYNFDNYSFFIKNQIKKMDGKYQFFIPKEAISFELDTFGKEGALNTIIEEMKGSNV